MKVEHIKTTLVDYPGLVATAIFFAGCNLRCPYCYNVDLNGNDGGTKEIDEVKQYLLKREGVIDALVISGGEALLHFDELVDLILFAKKHGYKVKLDTNGTLPDELLTLIGFDRVRPDFVAMDIKAGLCDYNHFAKDDGQGDIAARLRRTIRIMTEHYDADHRQWRTVLVPRLVDKTTLDAIAKELPQDAWWRLSQFRNTQCLNKKFEKIEPYTQEQLNELYEHARGKVARVELVTGV